LLTETGLLGRDQLLAGLAHASGGLVMLAALAWGSVILVQVWRGCGSRLM